MRCCLSAASDADSEPCKSKRAGANQNSTNMLEEKNEEKKGPSGSCPSAVAGSKAMARATGTACC